MASRRRVFYASARALGPALILRLFSQVRGGAAAGNRTPDLPITRPHPASSGIYQQRLQTRLLQVHTAAPFDLVSHHV